MQILIDGSNVLFWRGGQAQADMPLLVTRALIARRFEPVVYFDHSIHKHMGADRLDHLRASADVKIASVGTPADAMLLDRCNSGRIQIVSADRFRVWRMEHPRLRSDWLVTGRIGRGGRVSFSKKLRAAPL